jgi:tRNA pseudouridine55 synthase
MDFIKGEVLLVDKAREWTSFDVIKSVRNSIKKALNLHRIKVGHAGTLDPLATGLLIVCTGKMTKQIDHFQAEDKVYTGTITLGAVRPSYDLETEITETFPYEHISEEQIYKAAQTLTGDLEQVPPMFSAIKINGVRAYHFARENQEIELKKRSIHIHKFEITGIELPEVHFEIKCSKGTYIRSLARDFGVELNNGAHLSALRRTAIGEFKVEDALTVEKVKEIIATNDIIK